MGLYCLRNKEPSIGTLLSQPFPSVAIDQLLFSIACKGLNVIIKSSYILLHCSDTGRKLGSIKKTI
jgi:hypothetical protein